MGVTQKKASPVAPLQALELLRGATEECWEECPPRCRSPPPQPSASTPRLPPESPTPILTWIQEPAATLFWGRKTAEEKLRDHRFPKKNLQKTKSISKKKPAKIKSISKKENKIKLRLVL